MSALLGQLKVLVAKIITTPFVGHLLLLILQDQIRRNGAIFDLGSSKISGKVKAQIFWNLYEKAEIDFIKRYLSDDHPVVELGGSIGIVSAVIGKLIGGQSQIVLEANPELVPIINEHLRINKGSNYEVIHAGIGIDSKLYFHEGTDNTVGIVSAEKKENSLPIPTKTLQAILSEYAINTFSLVADIEGAEAQFIFESPSALSNCRALIIELHETAWRGKTITVDNYIRQLEKLGFTIRAQHGPVVFAAK